MYCPMAHFGPLHHSSMATIYTIRHEPGWYNIAYHAHNYSAHTIYNRIVVAGDIRANVVQSSTQVFLFDKEYGLTQDEV